MTMTKTLGLALLAFVASSKADESPTDQLASARTAWLEEDWGRAVELLDGLAEAEGLGEYARARVAFAKGVVLAEEREESPVTSALGPFRSARALAGPTQLRLDAHYNGAWVDLDVAEQGFRAVKASLEPSAQTAVPGPPMGAGTPPGMSAPSAGPAPEAPDFETLLAEARAAYGAARSSFAARLKADWQDEDTRANLEWIQRRLEELDELEQQQEEQEQQDQQDDSDQDQQENQDQENDQEQESDENSENSEDSQDESEQESDGSDGEQQDESDEPRDSEDQQEGEQEREDDLENPDPGEEQTPGQEGEPEQPEPEPQPEEGDEQGQGEEQPPQPLPQDPGEQYLTKEEMQRLLDQLQKLEEEGERVRAALRKARRIPVERDW